uniref:Uncharacterized protein n=1 Tax=Arundo donax TaxID=35708 RepID=A0A0A9B5F4_ARUDO
MGCTCMQGWRLWRRGGV